MIISIPITSPSVKRILEGSGVNVRLYDSSVIGCCVCKENILGRKYPEEVTDVIFNDEYILYEDVYYIIPSDDKHNKCRALFKLCPLDYVDAQHEI